MEPIAERPRMPLVGRSLTCVGLLVLGCSRPSVADSDDADSQVLQDLPADLPNDLTEYEGILYGIESSSSPTDFWECTTAEAFEISYPWQKGEVWVGSCYGVYQRVRGHLDRSFEPPRLFVQETLEARWSNPSDCSFFHEPDYESCALEDTPDSYPSGSVLEPCEPVNHPVYGNCPYGRCSPERFDATEFAGWKDFGCGVEPGLAGPGEACEQWGDADTCIDFHRCWNSGGDLTMPGVCVPYCDLTGEFESPCSGTCLRCSSSDRWGLCVTDCSGDDCNVDAFC